MSRRKSAATIAAEKARAGCSASELGLSPETIETRRLILAGDSVLTATKKTGLHHSTVYRSKWYAQILADRKTGAA